MTPAEQKEAEANGASLREVKSEVSSNSSCEDIAPFQKRSRRKECIFITIAVVLGAGLIAVLVYFSVTNALKEDEPIARGSQGEDSTSTTPDYGQNYDYQTGDDYNSGPQTRDASGGDSSPGASLRSMQPAGSTLLRRIPPPSGESSPGETGNTVPLEKSSRTLLRGSDASSMVDNTNADTGEGTQTDDASSTVDNTNADTGEGTQTDDASSTENTGAVTGEGTQNEEAGANDVSNVIDRSSLLRMRMPLPPPPTPSATEEEEKKEEQTEK